uniref:Interleukin 22 receptor, alpha 2 n=1 Tax=Tetraodon nigroviridis TaxID=99883 RepID=H3DHY6_TETNG
TPLLSCTLRTNTCLCLVTFKLLLLYLPQEHDLAPPTNLRFDSVDYKNVLSWSPPANGSSLLYDVQWKIYGDPDWLDAASCRGTQKLRCDLSSETSVPREWYYARVRSASGPSARSAWALSRRFSPRWATRISPPVLKLKVSQQKVVVQVEPPRLHIRKMHSSLQFKIYLTHPSGEEGALPGGPPSPRKLTLHLRHRQRYCVQAQTQILLQAKSSARSPPTCVSTL